MPKKLNKKPAILTPELEKALLQFPKIVKEQERNYELRERDIRRFDNLVQQLKKMNFGMTK